MTPQDVIFEVIDRAKGMWRFRWHMLLTAWFVAATGWVLVYRMPDVYLASARVAVDTNSLLPNLTEGLTATESVVTEVDVISKAMLSRPNLEVVARETDMDLRATTPRRFESLIAQLKLDIDVQGGRDNIFDITFTDTSRQTAVAVVSSLLNAFVDSSLSAQGDDTDVTEKALRLEIADHEERLVRAENRLADFKKRNIGYMPGDGSDYYSQLQTALAAVTSAEQRARELRERRDEIARQLEGEEPVFGIMPSTPAQAVASCSKSVNIADLQSQLSTLQVTFTDKHPRILMLRETIASLEQQCAKELSEGGGFAPLYDSKTQSLDANPVYQNLKLQLSTAEVELAALQEVANTARLKVAQLRSDVDKIADVETELKRLNRDYDIVEDRHQELLRRWETLQSRKRLDPVTEDLQFNILEPPFSPLEPVAPNRPMLTLAVLILGLGVGIAITFGLNELKPVFFSRRKLHRVCGLPVLGNVSMMFTEQHLAASRRNLFAWISGNAVLMGFCALIIFYDESIRETARGLFGML